MDADRKQRCERKEGKAYKMASTLPNMGRGDIPSDILGSYTGTSQDGQKPDQDADDL
ncbi:hypothetical protein [Caproiciproducens galactitolivorans]|uniref:Uncharacterized protein n=1 Tax=Caproiciproducens galactitolivorans TaxID=642589 RepID=A0A4Z0YFX5_9FIRM|nr:hypothetical protein [Caproiciproducens galactitolivorans]TGJ77840.1 hypothetical protein CAGA_02450 [Caproiciproducens galactitolivorans]